MRLGLSRFTAFSKFQSESSSLWQSQPSGRNITANLRNKTLSKPAVEAGVSPAILEFAVDTAASTGSVQQYTIGSSADLHHARVVIPTRNELRKFPWMQNSCENF